MNEINVNLQHSISTLAGNGWSSRRIARAASAHNTTHAMLIFCLSGCSVVSSKAVALHDWVLGGSGQPTIY